MSNITLQKDHTVQYGDFRIITEEDNNGKEYLVIYTKKGLIEIKPQAVNIVSVHSDKSKIERRKKR